MNIEIPVGARAAARVVLLSQDDELLYLHARDEVSRKEFWVMPGGGLETGESFKAAAKREVLEETGIDVDVGPCLWTRHHVFDWESKSHSQFEVFYLARSTIKDLSPSNPDSYIFDHKWWSIAELKASKENFAPRKIGQLIVPVIEGCIPSEPFECGI